MALNARVTFVTNPCAPDAEAGLQKQLDSELLSILEEEELPGDVIAKIASLKYKTVAKFPKAPDEDNDIAMRKFIKEDIELDGAASSDHRSHVSGLLSAWGTCKLRGSKRKEFDASERAANKGVRQIPTEEHALLRKALTDLHGPIPKHEMPGESLVQSRLTCLEKNIWVAEFLTAEVSWKETEDEMPVDGVHWSVTGVIQTERPKRSVCIPSQS